MTEKDRNDEIALLLSRKLAQEGKPESKALPRFMYGNPANHVQFQKKNEKDAIDFLLEDWAEWMKRDVQPTGYPSRTIEGKLRDQVDKSLEDDTHSSEDDSEILYEQAHNQKMEIVDTCVDSVTEISRVAIYIRYGIRARVFRMSTDNGLYDKAKVELLAILKQKKIM